MTLAASTNITVVRMPPSPSAGWTDSSAGGLIGEAEVYRIGHDPTQSSGQIFESLLAVAIPLDRYYHDPQLACVRASKSCQPFEKGAKRQIRMRAVDGPIHIFCTRVVGWKNGFCHEQLITNVRAVQQRRVGDDGNWDSREGLYLLNHQAQATEDGWLTRAVEGDAADLTF